ncbi:uncharacterized protein [Cicer arietinum]|uniref:Senescence/dehydration-associated protein At4g35985, chloroplastic-like n=1 Tax=Cicer arietinum TaxID=3827 RepID=A0A3Q7XWQ2_CICAR|nr:senescence/dehydration-associated protein At4g35985, chloroplastic-like [Cicer arietinum]
MKFLYKFKEAIIFCKRKLKEGLVRFKRVLPSIFKKGWQTIIKSVSGKKNEVMAKGKKEDIVKESVSKKTNGATMMNKINEYLKCVRDLSNEAQKLSQSLFDGVRGRIRLLVKFTVDVVLASIDALDRGFEKAESAGKQVLFAISQAATKMVSKWLGEEVGEAIEHVFATTGHTLSIAWNFFKIWKIINPPMKSRI